MEDHVCGKSMIPGKSGGMRKARPIWVLAAVILLGVSCADAGTITATTAGWFTTAGVSGGNWQAGSTVSVTFTNGAGTVTGTATGYPGAGGSFWVALPAGVSKGDTITFSGTEGDGTIVNNAAGGVVADTGGLPPGVEVADHSTIGAGSTLSVASQLLNLTGSFTSLETGYDGNPASPTYGDLSLTLLSSGFNVGSSTGPLSISLNGDVLFTLDLTSFLGDVASGHFTSTAIPISIPLDLTVTYGGTPYAATGTATGSTTTFSGDQADPSTLNISLTSPLGPITGALYTTSQDSYVPEPSPGLLLLIGLGLLAAGGLRRRAGSAR